MMTMMAAAAAAATITLSTTATIRSRKDDGFAYVGDDRKSDDMTFPRGVPKSALRSGGDPPPLGRVSKRRSEIKNSQLVLQAEK